MSNMESSSEGAVQQAAAAAVEATPPIPDPPSESGVKPMPSVERQDVSSVQDPSTESEAFDIDAEFANAWQAAQATEQPEPSTVEPSKESTEEKPAAIGESKESSSETPAGEAEAESTQETEDSPAQGELQGALRRAEALREQDRLDELSPTDRGQLDRYERGVIERHMEGLQQEQAFHKLYQDLEQARERDPGAFMRMIDEHPQGDDLLVFHRNYKREHPDVTATSAFQYAVPEAEQVDITSLATARGVSKERAEALKGDPGALIDEIVTQRVAAETATIREAEKVAAQQEAQAATIAATRVPPAQGGAAPDPNSSRRTGAITLEQALADAEEALA